MTEYNNPPQPDPTSGGAQPGELMDRFVARLIDTIVIFAINFILTGLFVGLLISSGSSGGVEFIVTAIFQIVAVAIQLGYFVFFETSKGQTLGKMVMKLKVVGQDGQSLIDPVTSVKRNVFYLLGLVGIIPILGLLAIPAVIIAYVMVAVTINSDTARRQGWHDKFADTQVLKIG